MTSISDPQPRGRVRIWDLPTRLFHWLLVACVAGSIISIKTGSIDWHMRFGYAVLSLVLFRLLWGFAGSRYVLFSHFVRGPGDVLAYVNGRLRHAGGHNPLGALSVLALLLLLLVQASGGLFANDGSFSEGPLVKLISGSLSNRISTLHRWAEWAIYALLLLHLAAVAFYAVFKSEPLVGAMLHGDRQLDAEPAQDDAPLRVRGLMVFLLAAALTWYVVTL